MSGTSRGLEQKGKWTVMTGTPVIVRTRADLANSLEARHKRAHIVAFVPTMGALHEGHCSLLRRARTLGDTVVVSIFVNPLQFGPGEDLDRYPRALQSDVATCRQEKVDMIFAPAPQVVYPQPPRVTVSAGELGAVLEGANRSGHFDGVLTVVLKLFHLVRPDVAVFGEKDAQQLMLVRRMAHDLDVAVRIESVPTVRDPDGLACSSRNRYLSPAERRTALALPQALRAGAALATSGPKVVCQAARAVLDEAARADPPLALDYLALVDPTTFAEVSAPGNGTALLVVAGRVGATRLIDNLSMSFPGG